MKVRIHDVNLILLAAKGGLEVFKCGFHFDFMNLAAHSTAQLLDNARMIGGMNLLGAARSTEQAGGPVQSRPRRP